MPKPCRGSPISAPAKGRLEEAEALLADCDDAAMSLTAAELRLVRGEPAVAVAFLERCMEQLGDSHIEAAPTLAMLVDAHIASGNVDAAEEALARLNAVAQAHGGERPSAFSARASAHVSTARGQPDVAIGQLESALDHFTRLDLPLETARVQLELAGALAGEKHDIAVAEASKALKRFEQLGAATDADAAASLLRSLGAPARTGSEHVGVLTKREQEVLRLVGLGLSNPEIAQRLFISRRTAEHHVAHILSKLDLRSRAEAAAYAVRAPPEDQ